MKVASLLKRRPLWRSRKVGFVLAATALTAAAGVAIPAAQADAPAANAAAAPAPLVPKAAMPKVTGPIAGTPNLLATTTFPLSSVGYKMSEYFFSGTASSYKNVGSLGQDGRWTVTPATSAPYTSRMIVMMPSDPAKFSGTVVVEWMNVSALQDATTDWIGAHNEMIRSGDAYVGVSAQYVGVDYLKLVDKSRYASLNHPGDSYSYDIYSQAGMAVRNDPALFGGKKPTTVLADGESQSAVTMTTYVDAVAPIARVYDGYLIHSRFAATAPLSEPPQATIEPAFPTHIRTDLTVPVLLFETETDILGIGFLNYNGAVQPDTDKVRTWEVAGTAHADAYESITGRADNMTAASDQTQVAQLSNPPKALCTTPLNTGEQHYVLDTALHDLTAWAQTGVAPPVMPRFATTTGSKPAFQLDANGNVVGGIRTPAVDAPLSKLSGLPAPKAGALCTLFGETVPFTQAQITALYPTHADFVTKWHQSVATDEAKGYLLPADAAKLDAAVAATS